MVMFIAPRTGDYCKEMGVICVGSREIGRGWYVPWRGDTMGMCSEVFPSYLSSSFSLLSSCSGPISATENIERLPGTLQRRRQVSTCVVSQCDAARETPSFDCVVFKAARETQDRTDDSQELLPKRVEKTGNVLAILLGGTCV